MLGLIAGRVKGSYCRPALGCVLEPLLANNRLAALTLHRNRPWLTSLIPSTEVYGWRHIREQTADKSWFEHFLLSLSRLGEALDAVPRRDEAVGCWLKVKSSTGRKGEARRSLDRGIGNLHHCHVVQAMGTKVSNPVCSDEGVSLHMPSVARMHMPSVVTPVGFAGARGGFCHMTNPIT